MELKSKFKVGDKVLYHGKRGKTTEGTINSITFNGTNVEYSIDDMLLDESRVCMSKEQQEIANYKAIINVLSDMIVDLTDKIKVLADEKEKLANKNEDLRDKIDELSNNYYTLLSEVIDRGNIW